MFGGPALGVHGDFRFGRCFLTDAADSKDVILWGEGNSLPICVKNKGPQARSMGTESDGLASHKAPGSMDNWPFPASWYGSLFY